MNEKWIDAAGCVETGRDPVDNHLTVESLRRCVSDRRKRGDRWEMPDHLSECPLCLAAYEVILNAEDQISPAVVRRIRRSAGIAPSIGWSSGFWLKAAVYALMVGVAILWMAQRHRPLVARMETGVVVMDSGPSAPAIAAGIPVRGLLRSQTVSRLRLSDGSEIRVQPGSRFEFSATADAAVSLVEGEIEFEVAPQKWGRRFTVKTPLGDILVVGTRFRVTCRQESVTVFQNSPAGAIPEGMDQRMWAALIRVEEGRVQVRNAHESVLLGAGETAILRERQPMIERKRD